MPVVFFYHVLATRAYCCHRNLVPLQSATGYSRNVDEGNGAARSPPPPHVRRLLLPGPQVAVSNKSGINRCRNDPCYYVCFHHCLILFRLAVDCLSMCYHAWVVWLVPCSSGYHFVSFWVERSGLLCFVFAPVLRLFGPVGLCSYWT